MGFGDCPNCHFIIHYSLLMPNGAETMKISISCPAFFKESKLLTIFSSVIDEGGE